MTVATKIPRNLDAKEKRLYRPLFLDREGDLRPSVEREFQRVSLAIHELEHGSSSTSGINDYVKSVNGMHGEVLLSFDPKGTAQMLIDTLKLQPNPFPQYLLKTDLGTYATQQDIDAAIAAHEAKADPHPQYLTQAEGDARYAPINTSGSGNGPVTSVNARTGDVVITLNELGGMTQAEMDARYEQIHPDEGGPVQSVNTKTGHVVLNAQDVGADGAGTADALMKFHLNQIHNSPNPNPHPQYLTNVNASATYSPIGHTHTLSQITDGLSTIHQTIQRDLVAGTGITLQADPNTNTVTIASTGGAGSSNTYQYYEANGATAGQEFKFKVPVRQELNYNAFALKKEAPYTWSTRIMQAFTTGTAQFFDKTAGITIDAGVKITSDKANPQIIKTNVAVYDHDFGAIHKITVNNTHTGQGKASIVFSRDNVNWKAYVNKAWVDVAAPTVDTAGATTVLADGTPVANVQQLGDAEWTAFFGGPAPDNLFFAIALSAPTTNDNIVISDMYHTVDGIVMWRKQTEDQVPIYFTERLVLFKTMSAGDYKLAYQA